MHIEPSMQCIYTLKMIFKPIAILIYISCLIRASYALDERLDLLKQVDSIESDAPVLSTDGNLKRDLQNDSNEPWSFLVFADFHGTNSFSFEDEGSIQEWDEKAFTLRSIKETYGGELVLLPGDVNSYGKLTIQDYADRYENIPITRAVYSSGYRCYTRVRQLFGEAGFPTILAGPGDHELGGNRGFVTGKHSKLDTIPSLRQAFADGFNSNGNADEHFIFNESIGAADSRPMGTVYQGTSFAYRYKNVLFVTVDAFEIVGENYIDKDIGTGGEGAVRCTVTGDHLDWFKKVLREGEKDPTIKHTIVQAHLPIAQPVRKVKSSGQFFDRGTESTFWKVMERFGVDIYLAGEVHGNTVIKSSRDSNLVQISSRARAFGGFLKIEVSDNILKVKAYNEVGTKKKWNGTYQQHGFLRIKKEDQVTFASSGELEILDPSSLLVSFDFKRIAAIDERQVLGFQGKYSLLGDNIFVRGVNCTKSMHNRGTFGAQYDAQVANIELEEGAMGYGSSAGVFKHDSIFALFANGPFGAGQPISFTLWFKTNAADQDVILLHYGTTYGAGIEAWNSLKDHFSLTLEEGNLHVILNRNRRVRPQTPLSLADDSWHFIAINMPRHSARPSEIEMYVDGIRIPTKSTGNDEGIFTITSGRLSLGGFGYSANQYNEAYPTLKTFNGLIGDFSMWARPLEAFEVELPSHEPSASPSISINPSSQPTSTPSVSPTVVPTRSPSQSPSMLPSTSPSDVPSTSPSEVPSSVPSEVPSVEPSSLPSEQPSIDMSNSIPRRSRAKIFGLVCLILLI